MLVNVVVITPQPGRLDELAETLRHAFPAVHDEPGCLLYALHRNADKLVIIEKWTDSDALAAHGESATMAELGAKVGDLIVGSELITLEPVPSGDSGKGAL